MSVEAVTQVIERVLSDPDFQEQCFKNPDEALASYDLTDEEREAILSGEGSRLEATGLDPRLAKTAHSCCCCH